jgi:glutamate-1-semialdehyde 2,1-aminomutase
MSERGDTPDRLRRLIEEQERIFVERQPRSRELTERARRSLAGGATSSWQVTQPQAVWIGHGEGSKVYDPDGNEYVDLHGGYGVAAVGHAHPAVVDAIRERAGLGTHFAQPTEDSIAVSEELARRFRLPLWRFNNSGTEATMRAAVPDSIHCSAHTTPPFPPSSMRPPTMVAARHCAGVGRGTPRARRQP